MKKLLHVGSGFSNILSLPEHFQAGDWEELRYDIDEAARPDIVGSMQDMSIIEDGSIDAIFSSHNIEHVCAFEVPIVFAEFLRVLKPNGFVVILCPDILSVAQAIIRGELTAPLYLSPVGPITAIDLLYGHQSEIQKNRLYMAHKTAFTAHTLSEALASAAFAGGIIVRDKNYGLRAVATKTAWGRKAIDNLALEVFPSFSNLIETLYFGCQSSESPPSNMPSQAVEIISATRMSEREFWSKSALGISLKRLRDARLVADITFDNRRGLPDVFNTRINASDENGTLVFIHDDVWIDDDFFVDRIIDGLKSYDVIGTCGNRRRARRQHTWCYFGESFSLDDTLSGRIAHGDRPHGEISMYGPFPDECELLDGAFLAVKKMTLKTSGVRFDPRFDFHFYDLDFCRSAREKKLRLGTWPVGLTHQSVGAFSSSTAWLDQRRIYWEKWDAVDADQPLKPTAISFDYRSIISNNALQNTPSNTVQEINAQAAKEVETDNPENVLPDALYESERQKIRGNEFLAQGNLDEAIACYRQAALSNPKHAAAFCNLGFALGQRNRYEESERELRSAISLDPTIADTFYILGIVLLKQKNLNGAIESFDKALRLKSDFEIVYSALFRALLQSGQIDSARKVMEQGIALNPGSTDFHFYLGTLPVAPQ